MNSSFEFLDYLIFVIYGIVILGLGLWVSRNKEGGWDSKVHKRKAVEEHM